MRVILVSTIKSVLIAVPTYENIAPQTFKSIYDLDISGLDVDFIYVTGYDCARARNEMVLYAIKSEKHYDYIFMVDSDIVLKPETLTWFFQDDNFDIIMGYYRRKDDQRYSEVFMMDDTDDYSPKKRCDVFNLLNQKYTERIEIHGGGFGCTLIKLDIFENLEYPWFKYESLKNGDFLSEDLYFCNKARKAGYKILCDTRALCGHVAKRVII